MSFHERKRNKISLSFFEGNKKTGKTVRRSNLMWELSFQNVKYLMWILWCTKNVFFCLVFWVIFWSNYLILHVLIDFHIFRKVSRGRPSIFKWAKLIGCVVKLTSWKEIFSYQLKLNFAVFVFEAYSLLVWSFLTFLMLAELCRWPLNKKTAKKRCV